ncbi:MAG: response regulator [Bacteroidota bacterium]|nr:response regulator [Bacteroidota bacterium]MDP4191975.1 response regulator [Bacteroidota bacterium]MDP4196912.1 response regulator [Bacteroidota bacterium]
MEVLVIEDNEGDRVLIMEAIADVLSDFSFRFKIDGEKASEYFNEIANEAEAVLPDLVILDINLPKKNGLEILEEIRQNKKLSELPVIIFSTSSNSEDIAHSRALGILDYVVKPIDFFEYQDAVKKMLQLVSTS